MDRIEEKYRQSAWRYWEGRPLLDELTHVIGGVGLGLLLARRARPLGLPLLGLSYALHLYAFFTGEPGEGAVEMRREHAA